jgi:uncharacterized protein (DUF1015 family)
MVRVNTFRAVRPDAKYASQVAALPYDVMNTEEARAIADANPLSFLRIDRAEINLPASINPYDPSVYAKASEVYQQLKNDGVFITDEKSSYYIYRLTVDGRAQTGVVACAAVDDYISGAIKKHENTLAKKEEDRVKHVTALDANTGPIFLAHKDDVALAELKVKVTERDEPIYDFTDDSGVRHQVWIVTSDELTDGIRKRFAELSALYIADGHHRCASAVRVAKAKRESNPDYTGDEEFNFFLAVIFPAGELAIQDYNRVVVDSNVLTYVEFLEEVYEKFNVEPQPKTENILSSSEKMIFGSSAEASQFAVRPTEKHEFGMYIGGGVSENIPESGWYRLKAKEGTYDAAGPIESLDVAILQNNLLAPILGIDDPVKSDRIDFVGGIRGLGELERRANSDMKIAFSLHPVSMGELMAVADAGLNMPPKSTWFEPKLLSGLFIHELG